jgi:hypothetical protein
MVRTTQSGGFFPQNKRFGQFSPKDSPEAILWRIQARSLKLHDQVLNGWNIGNCVLTLRNWIIKESHDKSSIDDGPIRHS